MSILALISVLLTAAAIFGWLSVRVLRLPITIGTMLITIVASLTLMLLSGHLPGLHGWAVELAGRIPFEDLVLHGMLGPLLFGGAFLLDLKQLARQKLVVSALSLGATLLSMFSVATLLHLLLPLLGLPASWLACMFFGALISPTDPIAVLEMLHRIGVSKTIEAQLAGESLFNDGVAAVLFLGVLEAARGNSPSIAHLGTLMIVESGGGLLLGIALAWLASQAMRLVDAFAIELLCTLALALGGYALAMSLHLSAPLEAVAAGLALRHFNDGTDESEISHLALNRFWRALDEVQNALLFVLLGLEVLAIPFLPGALRYGALAIAVVSIVRFATVTVTLFPVRLIQRNRETSVMTLTWGGLRGGLSIALALAVPAHFGRDWILSSTYMVVVFSILVQGGTMDVFLKRWNARKAA